MTRGADSGRRSGVVPATNGSACTAETGTPKIMSEIAKTTLAHIRALIDKAPPPMSITSAVTPKPFGLVNVVKGLQRLCQTWSE